MLATNSPVLTVPIIDPIEIQKNIFINKLIDCESGGNEKIKVLDTDGYYSYGLGQFHMATWLKYGKELGTTRANIFDGELQREVIRQMLDDGGASHWYVCSKVARKVVGAYQ
jgi:hypothetical protein